MRDTRSIESHLKDVARENKKKQLHKDLRKEVEVGANGTTICDKRRYKQK